MRNKIRWLIKHCILFYQIFMWKTRRKQSIIKLFGCYYVGVLPEKEFKRLVKDLTVETGARVNLFFL